MVNDSWLEKCKIIKNGLILVKPNEHISQSYVENAENTLKRINDLIEKEDFLWSSVMIYYCSYYLVYAFLVKLGVKCENHSCSIEFFDYLVDNGDLVVMIKKFRTERVDSQYYLKFPDSVTINSNYVLLKKFYVDVYNLCNLDGSELEVYISKIDEFFV